MFNVVEWKKSVEFVMPMFERWENILVRIEWIMCMPIYFHCFNCFVCFNQWMSDVDLISVRLIYSISESEKALPSDGNDWFYFNSFQTNSNVHFPNDNNNM